MAEFKAGTREQVKNGQAQYVAGDIVSKDAINAVGGAATRTKSVTLITGRDSSGRVTSSKTILYVEKNGTFQPAASKRDGKWNFSDPDYPLMAGVADADLQNELVKDSNSPINRTTNNGIKAELGKRADIIPSATGPDGKVYPGDTDVILQGDQNGADPWEAQDNGLTGQPIDTPTSSANVANSSAALGTQKNTGTRKKFGELKFPLDLGASTMDVIKFNMLEFKPRKTVNTGALGGFEDRKKNRQANNIGTVTLPVPAGIQDQNQAGWGDGRINPIQAAGVNFAMTAFNKGLGAAMSGTADKLGDIGANSGALKEGVKAYFTAAGVGVPLDQILARTQGQVLNPNLELLFNGPTLRPFNFTFKMSARSGKESEEIVRIIRFFKQGMSPQRTDSNLFVKAPHTFQLQYLHRGQNEHNFLNKFKECALIGMSVNYTPENNYATFEDGAMVSYEMQMQFKELDPVYNEDYTELDNNADTTIGF